MWVRPPPCSLVWGPPCPWRWGAVPSVASGGAACSLRSGEVAWGGPGSNRESPHLGALLFLRSLACAHPSVSTEKAPLLRNPPPPTVLSAHVSLASPCRQHESQPPLLTPTPHPAPAGPCQCRLTLRPPPPPPSRPQSRGSRPQSASPRPFLCQVPVTSWNLPWPGGWGLPM